MIEQAKPEMALTQPRNSAKKDAELIRGIYAGKQDSRTKI